VSQQCDYCGTWKWERFRSRKRGDPILPPWSRDKEGRLRCSECAKIKNAERILKHQNTPIYGKRLLALVTKLPLAAIPDDVVKVKMEQLALRRQLKETKHVVKDKTGT
jgi:hypothetical protein